ncbi:MAG TPA: ATP-dependent helicase [Candidatus Limnocylindrales bacterium]|nr:ATP-dependent helicase [Candidatus Limnocylindrales bacterium]
MTLHPAVAERLARLAPDQRRAATAPPGPVLCVAPAGSGKTTTLVARVAWLVAGGAAPGAIAAITFNVRAAEELRERLSTALAPLGTSADESGVRVRTFHAIGREILADAGIDVSRLVDRSLILRRLWPQAPATVRRRFDDVFSRLKLDRGLTLAAAESEVEGVETPDRWLQAFVAYERALQDGAELDFDDLVVRAVGLLEADEALLARWRARCANLLVDEVQDVDRTQLRLALLLAMPSNRIFLVGDDDQTIYGWRLADVRRVMALDRALPGLRRIDLETNYRCPSPVVERAVRLVSVNRERFEKRIRARDVAPGRLVLAADAADDHVRIARVMRTWPADGSTRAVLARTNAELLPAVEAALELGVPFRASRLVTLLDDERLDGLLDRTAEPRLTSLPLLVGLERLRHELALEPPPEPGTDAAESDAPAAESDADELPLEGLARALLAWAPRYPNLDALRAAIDERRARLAALRRDDAKLSLATIHGTKGLEFDHVVVVGMESGRFPNERSVAEALEPARALEEEPRLAYVAWTRSRSSLTLSFDPAVPSRFLLEAFDPGELPAA